MGSEPLFKGLISDENDQPITTAVVGSEPCYVINDAGFRKHIPSRPIDLEVLRTLGGQIAGKEEEIADQAAKLTGQDDLFSHAILENQLKNIEKQYETMLSMGLPEETRAYLGMMGFRVILDMHGEILKIEQPSVTPDEGGGEE
jgi:hypothetical protein